MSPPACFCENVKTISVMLHKTDLIAPPLTKLYLQTAFPRTPPDQRTAPIAWSYGKNDFAAASLAGR